MSPKETVLTRMDIPMSNDPINSPKFNDDHLLTSKETAEYLNITTTSLIRWKKRNVPLKYHKIGNRHVYKFSDIKEFLEKNSHGGYK